MCQILVMGPLFCRLILVAVSDQLGRDILEKVLVNAHYMFDDT